MIAGRASGKLLIIGDWGATRRRLQKLQLCMAFRTNALPLIIQTLSRTSDNVCSRPMWQLRSCNVLLFEGFGFFAQRVDTNVLFFL